eukprot:CAMPEP_0113454724 /NCGR_PEP_ID=MMETSP0014_2-20120614/8011_1 /TAXON_ID=2857 /ORGANISM="Nitzschia sp." /LENGTH=581 /DNA_ID=CAMNT_0000346139 /DNA_START=24 /DNA_END=1769 /DNA_ORIENTATION=- /assembly_acc=CAM_ASM_000159
MMVVTRPRHPYRSVGVGAPRPAAVRNATWTLVVATAILFPIWMMAITTYAFQAGQHHHSAVTGTNRISNRQQPRGTSSSSTSWTVAPSTPFGVSSHHQQRQAGQPGLLPLSMASSEDGEGGGSTKKKKSKKKKTKSAKKKTKRKTKTATVEDPDEVVAQAAEPVSASSSEEASATKEKSSSKDKGGNVGADGIYYGPNPETPDILNFDLTGGRPGSVIESLDDLALKQQIFDEIESGKRKYPKWFDQYGELAQDVNAKYDTDDPDAIDASTLGQYDVTDLSTKFEWEFDPEKGDADPNQFGQGDELQVDGDLGTGVYLKETPKDEDGIEVGFTSMYGTANPIDTRTEVGLRDSYMIDKRTRDDDMIAPEFPEGDVEITYNEDVVNFRKSIEIIDTYVDEFLPEDLPVPRHAAKWYGYPEVTKYPRQNYTNNRFTKLEDLTNFDELTPFRARQRAVELARAKNAEWMPDGVSQAWHMEQRRPYEERGTLVGSLRTGDCDPEIVEKIQPALKILGSCVDLLSIEVGTVFRFHYHGLMKNRYGMSCWAETLLRDCGVEVTGVVFETGFRARDPSYDSGDPYYGF